jgi:cytochrome c2
MPAVRASDDDVWKMVAFVKKIGSAGLEDKARGDAAAGKAVYESKGKCAVCHTIGREGGSLGPVLKRILSRAPRQAKLRSVGKKTGAPCLKFRCAKPLHTISSYVF